MTDIIKTSFTFSLGGQTDYSLSAEVDIRSLHEGGDNAARLGKTSHFEPGESIAFLIYLPSEWLEVDYIKTSIDNIQQGSISKDKDTLITITDEMLKFETLASTTTLSKYAVPDAIKKSLGGQWIGNDLGNLSLEDDLRTIKLPSPSIKITSKDNDKEIYDKTKKLRVPGLFNATYTTTATLYKLNTPTQTMMKAFGKPPYPISVIIYCKLKEYKRY
ncbi:MAG: hypothetical protein B6247_07775 [Candidatus Parabeggiatoa sp. nov. 2]|nr:MAG: hypothetical protein B6247_07775 [Beggiatoa sp. 4572_84]